MVLPMPLLYHKKPQAMPGANRYCAFSAFPYCKIFIELTLLYSLLFTLYSLYYCHGHQE